jgi:hypothetical protein
MYVCILAKYAHKFADWTNCMAIFPLAGDRRHRSLRASDIVVAREEQNRGVDRHRPSRVPQAAGRAEQPPDLAGVGDERVLVYVHTVHIQIDT